MSGKKIRLAQAGLGARGYDTLRYILQTFDNVEIIAVCDVYEDRVQAGLDLCREIRNDESVKGFVDYKEMVQLDDVDAVLVTSSWDSHLDIAIAAMKAGKYAGIECGGAYSINQCWELVRSYQATGKWCMYLENCCYNHTELNLLKLIKEGIFGEVVHCEGGYMHDLRYEISGGHENRHYRFDNYQHRNGELYPQHPLGPIQKFLNINRGNRMLTLTSMSSKSRGLHEWIVEKKGEDHPDAKIEWEEGDVVQTMIKCAHGETILLTHDTTLPHPYSRKIVVQGTKGTYNEIGNYVHLAGKSNNGEWQKFNIYEEQEEYEHPLWGRFRKTELKGGGHGGMDHIVLEAFFNALATGVEPPIDTYDAASLLSITPLSIESIAMGSQPVAIPDFTDGKWIKRGPAPRNIYTLDEIPYDLF